MILKVRNFLIIESCPKKYIIHSNRGDFTNKIDDIEKTKSEPIYKFTNKISYINKNDDIEKTKPLHNKFVTNRKSFNPLNPKYINPGHSIEINDSHPYKDWFIRDQMDVSDIDGAKPKKILFKSMYVPEDIKGSHPKKEIRFLKNNNYSYELKDNLKRKKSHRHTNPLDPVYELKYSDK